MSTAIARNLMAEMKLPGMFDVFDRLVTDATRHQWSCTDFLDAILQSENDFRSERKTKRRIKAAKFALRPTFEDFDFTANRSIIRAQIKDLYSLHWLSDTRPVLLIGKTFLAQDLGLHACAKGKSVLYMTFTTRSGTATWTWSQESYFLRVTGNYLHGSGHALGARHQSAKIIVRKAEFDRARISQPCTLDVSEGHFESSEVISKLCQRPRTYNQRSHPWSSQRTGQ